MMKKYFIGLLLVAYCITGVASPEAPPEIKALIETTLYDEYSVLIKGTIDKQFIAPGSTNALKENRFKELLSQHQRTEQNGYRFKNPDIQIKEISKNLAGDYALNVRVTVQVNYEVHSLTDPDEPFVTTKSENHYLFHFEQVDGQWRVASYTYIDPFAVSPTAKPEIEIQLDENIQPLNLDEGSSNIQPLMGNYNGAAASNYARRHWDNYNPDYRVFDGKGGDCTNFTSQSLRVGGWEDVGSVDRTDLSNWFYHIAYQSYTWVNAHYFASFNHNSGRSTNVSSTCDLAVGDIVSADWDLDGELDHTMIITRMNQCMPYLTYHSTDTLDRIFTDMPANANYYSWHIRYTN